LQARGGNGSPHPDRRPSSAKQKGPPRSVPAAEGGDIGIRILARPEGQGAVARPPAAGHSAAVLETTAGHKFQLGSVLDSGTMLLGRTTGQLVSQLWPNDDPFSARMNAVPRLVASRTLTDTSA
jgi:hypothetical protein